MPYTASERTGWGADVVVVSNDTAVVSTVAGASRTLGRAHVHVRDVGELLARIDVAPPRIVVVDRDDRRAPEVLTRLAGHLDRTRMTVVLVVRDAPHEPLVGADVIATDTVLPDALGLADRGANDHRAVSMENLLAITVLNGELEDALKEATDLIAAGFQVDRCLISIRGDSTGVGAVGERTWDSLAWSRTAEHCRAAVASRATLITSAGGRVRELPRGAARDAAGVARVRRPRRRTRADLPGEPRGRAQHDRGAARRRAVVARGPSPHGGRARPPVQRPRHRSAARPVEPGRDERPRRDAGLRRAALEPRPEGRDPRRRRHAGPRRQPARARHRTRHGARVVPPVLPGERRDARARAHAVRDPQRVGGATTAGARSRACR